MTHDLTPREQEIASLVARGMTNKAIAHQLGLTEGTVKQHMASIFKRLRIDNRTKLAMSISTGHVGLV